MISQQAAPMKGRKKSPPNRMLGFLLVVVVFEAVPTCTSADVGFPNTNTIEETSKAFSPNVINEPKSNPETLKLNSSTLIEHTLQRKSRALPLFENLPNIDAKNVVFKDEGKDSVQKLPTKSRYGYVIPYIRPGKKDSEKVNINPVFSKELMMTGARNKRSLNMIPNVRFGRTLFPLHNFYTQKRTQTTLIPMARYGRDSEFSSRFGELESDYDTIAGENINPISTEDNIGGNNIELDEVSNVPDYTKEELDKRSIKQTTGDTDYVIPYPRLGKSVTENSLPNEVSTPMEDSLSIIPQIRYGRSVSILSIPKTDVLKQSDTPNLILPYPRPGRSERDQNDITPNETGMNSKDINKAVENQIYEYDNNRIRKGDYMLPYARLGRSGKSMLNKINNKNVDKDEQIPPSFLKLNFSINPEHSPEHFLESEEKDEFFIIPYPRPGKRLIVQKSLIPNTRFERNIIYPNVQTKMSKSKDQGPNDFVLPYPRPGKRIYNNHRALAFLLKGDDSNYEANESNDDEKNNVEKTDNSFYFPESDSNLEDEEEKIVKKRSIDSNYIFPSFRPARSLLPILRPGRSLLPIPRPGRSLLPIPRPGRSLLPIPRPGRSLLPNLRPGRSLLPNLRPGRSLLPNLRPGRSLLPNLRPGRSLLPIPRPGRSLVPIPRPGRSLLPIPRPGRSLLPMPSPGRSLLSDPESGNSEGLNFVVPYPRPGRSTNVMLPYPRPGRSSVDNVSFSYLMPDSNSESLTSSRYKRKASNSEGFFIPYPRPGRSFSALLPYASAELPSSNEIFIAPYQRSGQSSAVKNIMPKDNSDMADSSSKSFVLPYPRPGRSADLRNFAVFDTNFQNIELSRAFSLPYLEENMVTKSESKESEGNVSPFYLEDVSKKSTVVPYPRPGRSAEGYVLPYPRMGRRDSTEQVVNKDQITRTDIIPKYAHKLHKHMLTSSANYILPYPRPGRFTE